MSYSLTVRDAVDHVHTWLGGEVSTRSHLTILQCVLSAYRELTSWRKWSYLVRNQRLMLHGSQTAGTVSYATGTRHMTIEGSTWPSWAQYGEVRIGDIVANVDSRNSATVLTMDSEVTFTGAIASTSSYELLHSQYLLPSDFMAADQVLNVSNWTAKYVQPRDWLNRERQVGGTGIPTVWTVMGHRTEMNRMAMFVDPAPESSSVIDLVMQRSPRELNISGYETGHSQGTISKGASDTTVTGTGTAFTSQMVGSVLRISSDRGTTPGRSLGPNPYWKEARIKSVASTTSLTLDTAITESYTSKSYVISDPIDIDPLMTEAFLRCCEKHAGVQRRYRNVVELDALYREARYTAELADAKTFEPRAAGGTGRFYRRLADFPLGDDQS